MKNSHLGVLLELGLVGYLPNELDTLSYLVEIRSLISHLRKECGSGNGEWVATARRTLNIDIAAIGQFSGCLEDVDVQKQNLGIRVGAEDVVLFGLEVWGKGDSINADDVPRWAIVVFELRRWRGPGLRSLDNPGRRHF